MRVPRCLFLPACAALSFTTGGLVEVEIRQHLACAPRVARAAWLDYQWSSGGGLPLTLSLARPPAPDAGARRRVLPLLLDERLLGCTADELARARDELARARGDRAVRAEVSGDLELYHGTVVPLFDEMRRRAGLGAGR